MVADRVLSRVGGDIITLMIMRDIIRIRDSPHLGGQALCMTTSKANRD